MVKEPSDFIRGHGGEKDRKLGRSIRSGRRRR
jgi:hypothetical protein